ncbi:DUF4012 domain-containing protein [Microbacterium sp. X-17]|uniref:DUF4012 domain-containing protein n=1 Tax=Microbacterium sp. X-17 TaxID=3144404 RepID=UPI0031F504A3
MATGLSHQDAPPRSAAPPYEARHRHRSRRGRGLLLAVIVVAALVFLAIAWVGLRGFLAQQELNAAVPDVKAVRSAVATSDTAGAVSAAAELQRHAHAAMSLTSDPVWQLAEGIPWVGGNLSAVSTISRATDSVATDVIKPLVSIAGSVDPRTLRLSGGKLDLAPFVAAQPVMAKAQTAFDSARRDIGSIDRSSVISPIGSAVTKMRSLMSEVAPDLQAADNTVRLLPGMLGANGPRSYLIVAQNPAELRATGGLIGSVALVNADKGAAVLSTEVAGTSIGPWPTPVFDVPEATTGLYGPLVGRYLQDVNFTPDFPLAARTAAAMWVRTHGGVVDGVITVDPVVLSAMLKATGPVALPSGDVLTSANAVPLLLSGIYARYPDAPQKQDAFFTKAASAVFDRVMGGVDGKALVKALAASGTSNRIQIWSSHPSEQAILQTTTLAGALPVSTPETAALGVYFNDATGSKMDYYLRTSVAAGAAVCRADGKVTSMVQVTLTNGAPANAATALPAYVTGAGSYGVPPGDIKTRIAFYGPEQGLLAEVKSKGVDVPSVAGTDGGRPVAVVEVQLAPGESKTIDVQFLGTKQWAPGLTVDVTPTLKGDGSTPDVGARPSVARIAVPCNSVVK